MEKQFLFEMLNAIEHKNDITYLGKKIGLESIVGHKEDLIKRIMKKNSANDLEVIVNNLSKEGLININYHLGLIQSKTSNKSKKILIKKVKDYAHKNFKDTNMVIIEQPVKDIKIDETKQSLFDITIVKENEEEKKLKQIDTSSYDNERKIAHIIRVIKNWEISKVLLKNLLENDFRDILLDELNKQIGEASAKFNIGKYADLKPDIDISKGFFGIDLKMSKSLYKTSEMERAIGQAYLYSTEMYTNNNYMFLIIGSEKDNNEEKIKDFERIVKKFNGRILYKTV
jgi:hypothetical protein